VDIQIELKLAALNPGKDNRSYFLSLLKFAGQYLGPWGVPHFEGR
jgi:hypothetical protein